MFRMRIVFVSLKLFQFWFLPHILFGTGIEVFMLSLSINSNTDYQYVITVFYLKIVSVRELKYWRVLANSG